MATPHIESKKEEIAKVVLMPGDPLRAKYIAEKFLENAKVVKKCFGIYRLLQRENGYCFFFRNGYA